MSRRRLLHTWIAQATALVPGEWVTCCRVLTLFTLGMIRADSVRLHRMAAALPLGVRGPSVERRLRRFLTNPAVTVGALGQPLLPHLLASWASREVLLDLDPMPHRRAWTVVSLGVVVHQRVLPLSWRVVLLRLPAGDHRLRLARDEEVSLSAWRTQVGARWHGPVAIFKDAGWRSG